MAIIQRDSSSDELPIKHDREIGTIIDQLNRSSDQLDAFNKVSKIVASATINFRASDYAPNGSDPWMNNVAFATVAHNQGYFPLVQAYALYNGVIHNVPFGIYDSTGAISITTEIYPTTASNSVNLVEVAAYAHNAQPAMTIYMFVFNLPATTTLT